MLIMPKTVPVLAFIVMLFWLAGCAAMHTQAQFGELKIYAFLDEPIMLITSPKTAYINFRAPDDVQSIKEHIIVKIREKGVRLVDAPEKAEIIYFILLSDATLEESSARQVQGTDHTLAAGSTSGGVAGYLARGDLAGTLVGAAVGATAGALVDVTVNNWVKLGELRVRGDILTREKTAPGNYREHKTRIIVRAQKTNLKWEDCEEQVATKFAEVISGSL